MPAFGTRTALRLARGLKAFVNVEVGLVRGEAPDAEQKLKEVRNRMEEQGGQLERAQARVRSQQKQIRRLRWQVEGEPVHEEEGWHRKRFGGRWDELGRMQLDFLLGQGLKPHHYLLDVGCGPLRGGVRFIPHLERGHYFGVDRSERMLEAGRSEVEAAGLQDRDPTIVRMDDFGFGRLGQTFDFALAQSVFTHLPLNSISRCLIEMDGVLKPGGVFFATFFENRAGGGYIGPLEQGDGFSSFYDRDPFHYKPEVLEWAGRDTSLKPEYIGDWGHPRHQVMMAFRKEG